MVVSAAKTTEKEILLDVDEANKMLRLLQYKDDEPIILYCFGAAGRHTWAGFT